MSLQVGEGNAGIEVAAWMADAAQRLNLGVTRVGNLRRHCSTQVHKMKFVETLGYQHINKLPAQQLNLPLNISIL